jgi:transglutaminase-like putative cysteine protease
VKQERLRLLLRDLAASAAFGAMAVSGQVPVWTVFLFLLALAVALAGRRPLADGRASAGVLLVAVVFLYALVAMDQMDMVVAACTTAALLTAQRMLARPGPRTDQQVNLASLLMVAGGAALSADLLFALCLLVYAVLAVLSQGLAVVAEAGGRPPPPRVVFRPLAVGVLLCLLGALSFFVLFPRLSWNVAARRGSASLGPASVGFSDTLRLGGTGVLKSNPRVVFRAELSPDPLREQLDGYWVGRRFDTFDGVQWSARGPPSSPRREVRLAPLGEGAVDQHIELLPAYGSRTLVGLDTPAVFSSAQAHQGNYSSRAELVRHGDGRVEIDGPGAGFSYRVASMPDSRRTGITGPEEARWLELPPKLDARIPALGQQLAAGASTPRAVARQLERALQSGYGYTLELPGPVKDPLADFLFQRQAGHCEDFATALAVLLRTQGIPSRVVVGFYGGERAAGEYLVRAGDAHAWVEAVVDGQALRLDATPPQNRAAAAQGLTAWLLARWEALQIGWLERVVDFSLSDQARLADRFRATGGTSSVSTWRRPEPREWGALAALAAVLLATAAVRFLIRSSEVEHLGRALASLLRASGRLGPSGWLDRAEVSGPGLEPVRRGITRYREARFGRRLLEPGEGRRLLRAARAVLRAPARPGP